MVESRLVVAINNPYRQGQVISPTIIIVNYFDIIHYYA